MSVGTAREPTAIPQWVGRYEVLVPIASGGMATVYLARSRGAGGFARDVALKLTHVHLRESPEFQSLLLEEAKLASLIRHHNVVSVLDVGDDPLGLFLVMDYVEGDTLSGLLRRARTEGQSLAKPVGFRILLDALAGLHAAHETCDDDGRPLALVHRDFSPQNILVGVDGISKLTDFGIAKAASRAGNTSTGILKGKISYMSPEQARGGTPLDRRADVWAAGVLAWETAAGRPLWPRDAEDVSLLLKLVTTAPPRLREVDPSVSAALDEAVAKALTMNPDDRWPTADAFAKALAAATPAASHDDVRAAVRALAGPKLEQRRAQVRSMGALRAKMGEITEAATIMTPSGFQSRSPINLSAVPAADTAQPPPQAAEQEGDRTEVVELARPAPRAPALPQPVAQPPAFIAPAPPSSGKRWVLPAIGAALGVVAVAALAIALVVSSHHASPRPPVATATTPPTETAAPVAPAPKATETAAAAETATAAEAATVAETATATVAETETATATATVAETATATPTPTPTETPTHVFVHHSHPHPPPTATTKLAPSPY